MNDHNVGTRFYLPASPALIKPKFGRIMGIGSAVFSMGGASTTMIGLPDAKRAFAFFLLISTSDCVASTSPEEDLHFQSLESASPAFCWPAPKPFETEPATAFPLLPGHRGDTTALLDATLAALLWDEL